MDDEADIVGRLAERDEVFPDRRVDGPSRPIFHTPNGPLQAGRKVHRHASGRVT